MIGTRTPNLSQRVDDLRNGRGGLVGVDGDADQFGAGASQRHHLIDGRRDIGGVGVGHRLDNDRMGAADFDSADINDNGFAAWRCGHEL